ncbi:MAG: FtsX-like permease family protein [Thermodesulfobacteriota bacterium]|nr:FtsX-like permease family protein [Thermodesulfobacteriota bacterium]MEE2974939.1 FtsX-like permease family protein [Thermodesulfobacteriota bacterium]
MKYEKLIILNYLKNIFNSKQNSIPAFISISAIAISVFSLILVLSVMKGFEVKVKEKIIQSFPHIIIDSEEPINLKEINGIKSFSRTFEYYSGVVDKEEFKIVQIKGRNKIVNSNNIRILKKNQIPINITDEFASQHKKDIGDKIQLLLPDLSKKITRIKNIEGIIVGIISEPDNNFDKIFTENDYYKFFNKDGKSFLEIFLINPFDSKKVKELILKKYSHLKFKIVDWQTINSSLFKLMNLERLSLAIFLSFLILISATTIYSNMVSLITQKKKEIGTLLLLGSKKKSLILIFTIIGLLVGFIGVIIGLLLAALAIFVLLRTDLMNKLSIDISFYQIDGFPIILYPDYFIQITIFSLLVIAISSFLPSMFLLNKDLESLVRRES